MNLKFTFLLLIPILLLNVPLSSQCSDNGGSCPAVVNNLLEMSNCVAASSNITTKDNYTETINCNYDLSGITFTLGKNVTIRFTGNVTVSSSTEFAAENGNHSIDINGIQISNSGDFKISDLNDALDALTGPSTLEAVVTALPVEFIFFKGKVKQAKVLLNWATAIESNNSHFEVQHSLNGKDFRKIKEIKGAGTTQVRQDYSYEYRQVVGGLNYYRLKQVDYDGQFEYSEVISVDVRAPKTQYTLFPNPVHNNFVIQTATGEVPTGIRLLNQLGQEVRLDSDTERVSLPPSLKRGLYILQFELNGQAFSEKILIQ